MDLTPREINHLLVSLDGISESLKDISKSLKSITKSLESTSDNIVTAALTKGESYEG